MTGSICNIMTCDEIARHYLPQIRAELVFRLVVQHGISQTRVARWIGLSRAAVSQYMHKKRGTGGIAISRELDSIIDSWADGIKTGDPAITICDICQCVHGSENPYFLPAEEW